VSDAPWAPGAKNVIGTDAAALVESLSLCARPDRSIRRVKIRAQEASSHQPRDHQPLFGHQTHLVQMALDRANRNRQARLLTLDDLFLSLSSLGEEPGSLAWTEGAHGHAWNFHASRTTLALFLRLGDKGVLLGVEECPAFRATPGRAWPCLRPWGVGSPETRKRKLLTWFDQRHSLDLILLEPVRRRPWTTFD
jgi:hypothetical protein